MVAQKYVVVWHPRTFPKNNLFVNPNGCHHFIYRRFLTYTAVGLAKDGQYLAKYIAFDNHLM